MLLCQLKMAGHDRPNPSRPTVRLTSLSDLAAPLRLKVRPTYIVRIRFWEEVVVEHTTPRTSLLTSRVEVGGLLVVRTTVS